MPGSPRSVNESSRLLKLARRVVPAGYLVPWSEFRFLVGPAAQDPRESQHKPFGPGDIARREDLLASGHRKGDPPNILKRPEYGTGDQGGLGVQ